MVVVFFLYKAVTHIHATSTTHSANRDCREYVKAEDSHIGIQTE